MRFMVLFKATKDSEAGKMPTAKQLALMDAFNGELEKAGIVVVDGAGLVPSSKGTRIKFSGDKTTIVDGPFAETKEIVGGYCLIEAKSHDEAVACMRRGPFGEVEEGAEIEIRRLFGPEDFA